MSAAHTPGVHNYEAEQLSRNLNANLDWSPTEEVFSEMLKAFPSRPTMDFSASRMNAKLPTYVFWKPDPFARYVDAFTVNMTLHPFYAFPPMAASYAHLAFRGVSTNPDVVVIRKIQKNIYSKT